MFGKQVVAVLHVPRLRLPRLDLRASFVCCLMLVLRNKRDAAAALAAMGSVAAILINALLLQAGPHPAPIFATRPLLFGEATGAIAQLPRPRPSAAAVGVGGPRDSGRVDGVPLPRSRSQAPATALRSDPIAGLLDPARQVLALQRILNDFGYGPIKITGVLDQQTAKGIERFERGHNLAVTGQNTPQLRHALSLATGQPLD